MNSVALVPAYRPSEELIPLVAGLLESFPAVVVVNDGSGPDFAPVFLRLAAMAGVTVLDHAVNLGKGAALKTGFNHILVATRATGIVTVDADGQHRPEDAARIGAMQDARPDALVLGCRDFSGKVPWRSRVGNVLTRNLLGLFEGLRVADTQTGLRGIPAGLAASVLTLPARGYEFELDMLILASKSGVPVIEEPISTIYVDDNASSHFRPIVDSLKIYFCLFRFMMAALVTTAVENLVFLSAFGQGMALEQAQTISRLVAMVLNFTLLGRFVFPIMARRVLWRYVASVTGFGLLSYMLIGTLTDRLGMGVVAAKLTAESVLFALNFLVQRDLVFVRRAFG